MIKKAITELKERGGSSRIAIQKYLLQVCSRLVFKFPPVVPCLNTHLFLSLPVQHYNLNLATFGTHYRTALKRGVDAGDLVQDKQSFKLAAKAKAAKKSTTYVLSPRPSWLSYLRLLTLVLLPPPLPAV